MSKMFKIFLDPTGRSHADRFGACQTAPTAACRAVRHSLQPPQPRQQSSPPLPQLQPLLQRPPQQRPHKPAAPRKSSRSGIMKPPTALWANRGTAP